MFYVACLPDKYVKYFPWICWKIPSDVSGSQKDTCVRFHGEKERAAGLYIGGVFVGRWEDSCLGSHFFLLISLAPTADGPRPTQKEIISLRAFMLLFLKQLILKVKPHLSPLPPSTCPSHSAGCWSAAQRKIWRWSTLPAQSIHSTPGNVCVWIKISCAETNLMESLVKRAVMNKWLVW